MIRKVSGLCISVVLIGCSKQAPEPSGAPATDKVVEAEAKAGEAAAPAADEAWERKLLAKGDAALGASIEVPASARVDVGVDESSGLPMTVATVSLGDVEVKLTERDPDAPEPGGVSAVKQALAADGVKILGEHSAADWFAIAHAKDEVFTVQGLHWGTRPQIECDASAKTEQAARRALRVCASIRGEASSDAAAPVTAPTPAPTTAAASDTESFEYELGDEQLQRLPDEVARTAARQLTHAMMANDAKRLIPLLAPKLQVAKKKLAATDARAAIERDGAVAFVGFEPYCDGGRRGCSWAYWDAHATRDGFQVLHGSGYGMQRVVNFAREDGAWKIVAIRDEDFGEP